MRYERNKPCPCGRVDKFNKPIKYKKCCLFNARERQKNLMITEFNKRALREAKKEHEEFIINHNKKTCYLCKSSYDDVGESPCLHWLLREVKNAKITKNHIKKVLDEFGFFSTNIYLRWIANTCTTPFKVINDLKDEADESKIIDETIIYETSSHKLEWSFSFGQTDVDGHATTTYSNKPHFHFQMKIDGYKFFGYSDHHPKLTDYDLEVLKIKNNQYSEFKYHNFYGSGMQEILDLIKQNPDLIPIFRSQISSSFIILANDGYTISGDKFAEVYEEATATGKSIGTLCLEKLENVQVTQIISAPDDIPNISSR